jgi:hypothetical protein
MIPRNLFDLFVAATGLGIGALIANALRVIL